MNSLPQKLVFLVPNEFDGKRIDQFLALQELILSRTKANFLIEQGRVLLNSKIAKSSSKIAPGDQIEVDLPSPKSSLLIPLQLKLDIVYEDNDLIVINKPTGLVVHPAHGHEQDTLVNALLAHTKDLSMRFGEERPGIVHRLDKETSGLLVVAKNDFTHEKICEQFKNKTTHRVYEALVYGRPRKIQGKIESTLARHPRERKKFASLQPGSAVEGKHAVTHYSLIKSDEKLSLLELKLETGRTHQIRIHMSELHHPLVGDILYGADKKKKTLTEKWQIRFQSFHRFFLHAKELGFTHPRKNEFLKFSQDWPSAEKLCMDEYFKK